MLVYSSPHPLPYTVCWLINIGVITGVRGEKGLECEVFWGEMRMVVLGGEEYIASQKSVLSV